MPELQPPRDNLVRAIFPGAELRDAVEGDSGPRLSGHLAVFNQWTKIDSVTEGVFMERIAPGAFRKTFTENRDAMKITLNHGKDPQLGDKPIAPVDVLQEDRSGAFYDSPLLEGVPPLVVSGLRAGVYGSSFRFQVVKDDWDETPRALPKAKRSPFNPDGLPERTIREARVYEFGPVTFPAYAGATAGVRSMTDAYREDPAPEPEPEPLPVPAALLPGAEPAHSAEGSRDDPPPSQPPVAAPKENPVDDPQYRTLDEMGARVRELDAEIKASADLPGVLPDAQQADFDAKVAERASLDHAMTAWRNRLAQVRVASEDEHKVERELPTIISRKSEQDIYDVDSIFAHARSFEDRNQKLRDNAMRSVEQAIFPDPRAPQDVAREHVARLVDTIDNDDKELASLILRTGSPTYKRAFNKYIKSLGLTPEEQRTALGVNVTTTGGFAVPYTFDPTIIAIGAHTSVNPFRAACRVEQITGGDTWRAITATAMTAAYEVENATSTESGPTFGGPSYQVHRASAFAQVSIEMMQDRGDIAGELAVLINEAKDTLEENEFAVGTGAGVYPFGMFTTLAFTNIDSVANDAIDVGDPEKVEAALPLRHRMNAQWFMARKTIRAYQALETSGGKLFGGQYYANVQAPATNSPTGNTGLKLLGYPIWEVPSAPTGVADGTITAVFGDPKKYIIVDRVGMTVEVIPHLLVAAGNVPIGSRGIFAYWRNTARPVDVNGMLSMSVA